MPESSIPAITIARWRLRRYEENFVSVIVEAGFSPAGFESLFPEGKAA
jgi:hypothetical protein